MHYTAVEYLVPTAEHSDHSPANADPLQTVHRMRGENDDHMTASDCTMEGRHWEERHQLEVAVGSHILADVVDVDHRRKLRVDHMLAAADNPPVHPLKPNR